MQTMLALAGLAGMNEAAVKQSLQDSFEAPNVLDNARVIIAYVSVGSWGCDSSAFVLFERDGKLFEVHGSHCSCYGFEGQWDPEETTLQALRAKPELFYAGGYDGESTANQQAAKAHLGTVPYAN